MSLLPLNTDQHDRRPPVGGFGDLFRLTGAVGPESTNARDDVIRAQILLGQTGDLDLDSLGGPTGWPGGELTRGLKRYQRRKGLTVDGLMLPDGETINALQDELRDRLAGYRAPTTREVDAHHDRMARRPSEHEEMPRTALVMPGEDAPAYVQQSSDVRSDIDQPLTFTPGAQVAQLMSGMQMMQAQTGVANTAAAAGAAGTAGTAGAVGVQQQLPPGVTPDMGKAGRQLEKWFDEKVNLLSLPAQMYHELTNGTSSAASSQSLDSEIEAASKTPPLMPSAAEEQKDYSGDLLAEGTRALESGIQDIFGTTVERHETENTRLSSNIIVKECNKVIAENIRLHGFDHVAGASAKGEGINEKSEASLKDGIKNAGGGGHSFPDVLYENGEWRVAINSATESAPDHYIGREVRSFAKLLTNIGKGVAKIIGKKRSDENTEDYEKRARRVCEDAFSEVLAQKDAGQRTADPTPSSP